MLRQPVHLSMLSWSSFNLSAPHNILSKLLLHITIVETMDCCERGMNSVSMTIINPWKEYCPSQGSNLSPPVLKSCVLPTELWGSAKHCWLWIILGWWFFNWKVLNTLIVYIILVILQQTMHLSMLSWSPFIPVLYTIFFKSCWGVVIWKTLWTKRKCW